MEKKNITILAVLIALLVLGYFGWMMWAGKNEEAASPDAAALFGEEEVNPFEESANPYENIKTNPFE